MISRHKYNAKRTVYDGIAFQSAKEAREYAELRLKQKAGLIKEIKRQVPFCLKAKTKTGREYKYLLDFECTMADGRKRYIEVKGYPTDLGEFKRAMTELLYDIEIEVV